MSNHNYSQYANKKPTNSDSVIKDRPSFRVEPAEVVDLESVIVTPDEVMGPDVKMVEETVETVALPTLVKGTVVHCLKLNVREAPSADANVLCVLPANTEIEINVDKTTRDWVSVCTATGIEGYCMRKFIDARL